MKTSYSHYIKEETTEHIDTFLRTLSNEATRKNYRYTLNSFADFVKKDLLQVSLEECRAYLIYLQEQIVKGKFKETTLSKYRKHLSSFYNYLVKNSEYLNCPKDISNYFAELPFEISEKEISLSRIPKVQELDRLFTYTRKVQPECCIAFLLAFKGYLTMEQLRCLKTSSFIYDSANHLCVKVVKVHPKTRKTEEYYNLITSDLEEIIGGYVEQLWTRYPNVPDPYLFSKDQKSPVTQKTIRNWLSTALKNLNLPNYTLNDLRNAGAIYALTYHAGIKDVADSLGYQTYRHIGKLKNTEITLNKAAEYIGIQFTPPVVKEN